MEQGQIVEYIDRQKILCAVVLDNKKQKLHLLNESNRELSLSPSRVLHVGEKRLDPSASRDSLLAVLKETAYRRAGLSDLIDIKELWEILNEEQDWIDADFVAGLCFPKNAEKDHESAVIRALFQNRLYFKFDQNRFLPYSEEQVGKILAQKEEEDRKNRMIEEGARWLKKISGEPVVSDEDIRPDFIEIIKSLYLHEKESRFYSVGMDLLKNAGISDLEDLFLILVKLKVFDENENIEVLRLKIPVEFPEGLAENISRVRNACRAPFDQGREDFTNFDIMMTIDGSGTRDFDDAVSVECDGENIRVGIHIIDVGHFIEKGSPIDAEALNRGSSIYMPDQKIPMLPPVLSEDACSLTADGCKPAISVMVRLTPAAKILDYKIIPSIIRVNRQLTYDDVDAMAHDNKEIATLMNIAGKFRQRRLMQGAVHISLPETQLWMDDAGVIHFQRIDRESPGRMLIAEMMIMANWLKARFLSENNMPAVFRSQPQPKQRLYKGEEGTLFQNYMQRRLLSRFKLTDTPDNHSGLGLDAYVTATSPIRKYYDLVTQRQIRGVLGFETPYTKEEINYIMQLLELPLAHVSRVQLHRNRYWMLKYLEKKIGDQQEAIVLMKRKNSYQILLPEFMIECDIAVSNGIKLKAEDLIHVKIQHADAKKDLFSVFLC